jgi:hypothetical protein
VNRLTYSVVRRPGGWAVVSDAVALCCYRNLEEAVARARQLGRDDWEAQGHPTEVQVETVYGQVRTEIVFE